MHLIPLTPTGSVPGAWPTAKSDLRTGLLPGRVYVSAQPAPFALARASVLPSNAAGGRFVVGPGQGPRRRATRHNRSRLGESSAYPHSLIRQSYLERFLHPISTGLRRERSPSRLGSGPACLLPAPPPPLRRLRRFFLHAQSRQKSYPSKSRRRYTRPTARTTRYILNMPLRNTHVSSVPLTRPVNIAHSNQLQNPARVR
jgi:hypothetical protein